MSAVPENKVGYRPMREADLDAVMAIESTVYSFPWTRGNFRDSLRAGYACWLCRGDHEVLGYAVLMSAADEVHLLNLSVAAESQRRGYGSGMLLFVIDNARAAMAHRMFLEVRPSNEGAQKLYTEFGFRPVGLRRAYYPAAAGREDALVMALDL